MSVINLPKSRNYVSIANTLARDANLSFEARGLMLYLLSHVGEWKVSAADIEKQGNIGPDKRRKIYRELEEAGYLRASRPRGEGGRVGFQIDAFEEPLPEHQRTCLLGAGARQNRSVEKPDSGRAETRQSATHKKDMSTRKTDLTENQVNQFGKKTQKGGAQTEKPQPVARKLEHFPSDDFSTSLASELSPLKNIVASACGVKRKGHWQTDDEITTQALALRTQGVSAEEAAQIVKSNPAKIFKLKFFAQDILGFKAAAQRQNAQPQPQFRSQKEIDAYWNSGARREFVQ